MFDSPNALSSPIITINSDTLLCQDNDVLYHDARSLGFQNESEENISQFQNSQYSVLTHDTGRTGLGTESECMPNCGTASPYEEPIHHPKSADEGVYEDPVPHSTDETPRTDHYEQPLPSTTREMMRLDDYDQPEDSIPNEMIQSDHYERPLPLSDTTVRNSAPVSHYELPQSTPAPEDSQTFSHYEQPVSASPINEVEYESPIPSKVLHPTL